LKKDVAYEQTKLVCQKDDTPWTFFVGNKTDDNPPEMSTDSIIKARTVSIPDEDNPLLDEPVDIDFTTQTANALPTLYDKSIYINVLVTDPDSGPASYFDMTVIDTADSTNTKTYKIYYNKVTSAKGRKYEGLYQLAGLKDGTYKISDLKFYDMKEQIIPNTNFSTQIKNNCINMCFKIDTSAPVVNTCNFSQTQSADLSFTHDGGTAIRKIKVKYRKEIPTWQASAYWDDYPAIEISPLAPVITGLDYGTRYQFQIELIDSLGNSKKLAYTKSTPALPLASVNYELIHTTGQKDKLKLTWQKPSQGNCAGVYIELCDIQTNEDLKHYLFVDKDNKCEYTMDYLKYGMNCIAKVYSVTSQYANDELGRTLEPFVSSAFSTKPVKPANPEPVVYSDPNNIEGAVGLYNIINTNGATGITKNKIWYKDSSNNNNPWVYYGESTIGESSESPCILEGLTPGKNYSLQIVPCNNDTEGDPYEIKNCVTLPGAVKNISITPEYNNYKYNLIVNWEAPSGDYNYCKIECYKGSYGSDSWVLQNTKTKTVYKSSGATSCTLENLDEFLRYKFFITTLNKIKIYNTSTSYTNT
ncbi:MAG: fibronectin type III domain-containing protein, partial [Methanobrevibacter sp.]|nr:fibronectin type III domain-containing protein [Methanobrevibacter sp.]